MYLIFILVLACVCALSCRPTTSTEAKLNEISL